MKRPAAIAFLAGLLPVSAVSAAYAINVFAGGELEPRFVCFPYLDGCVSISRAARSGPGIYLFKAVMLPCAILLLLTWRAVRAWLMGLEVCSVARARTIFVLGAVASLFLVFYVTALGTEGDWYRWMRRYGVTFYFGGTALAQLLLAWVLWPQRLQLARGRLSGPAWMLTASVSFQWVLGVLSVLKRLLLSDPDLIDRIENLIEWYYALPMSLTFIVVAWMFTRTRFGLQSGPAGSP